jgi:hypothetical protein
MLPFALIRCGTRVICLVWLLVAAGGCGCGNHAGPSGPSALSDDEIRASEAAARAAAEAEAAAPPAP